jgi:hypothetical protein
VRDEDGLGGGPDQPSGDPRLHRAEALIGQARALQEQGADLMARAYELIAEVARDGRAALGAGHEPALQQPQRRRPSPPAPPEDGEG